MSTPRKETQSKIDNREPRSRKGEAWDDSLRRVGDARYTQVEWSGRDNPAWPLPKE